MITNHNLLGQEKSPYLLQHRDNPVWWHPWGNEAFDRAKREDKPVFLSIGYSTCYWCHVMEKDSFERQAVADVLNERFVSIKVDREELPDVDQMYMEVVVGIHGHGGWPMSVFLTPERKPFWGGTFFYRDSFIKILYALSEVWKNERSRVLVSSEELTRYLTSKVGMPGNQILGQEVLDEGRAQLLARFDQTYGGFGQAPKFPPSQQIEFLLQQHFSSGDAASQEVICKTLTAMACGGIVDQLGGGFHRYSVDAAWRVPHFEKMLYDNALLIPLYLNGFAVTGDPRYRDVAERACQYLLQEMRDQSGAFYTAEDAGLVGREGEYYAWTLDEIHSVLPTEVAEKVCALYGVTKDGNFEHGTNVLTLSPEEDWQRLQEPEIAHARAVLLQQRGKRERPYRDDKILTGWNGLAISAFCSAYKTLRNGAYKDAAVQCAQVVFDKLHDGSRLFRRLCKGDVRFDANVEDYAYLIEGLLQLFEITGDGQWLGQAMQLQDEQHDRLWLADRKAYASSAVPGNIVQLCEWIDGACPSPNGVSLNNLLALAALTGEERFNQRAQALEEGIPQEIVNNASQYCSTLKAIAGRMRGLQVCAVVSADQGREPPEEVFDLWRQYVPYTSVAWCSEGAVCGSILEGKQPLKGATTWYICQNQTCSAPQASVLPEMIAGKVHKR